MIVYLVMHEDEWQPESAWSTKEKALARIEELCNGGSVEEYFIYKIEVDN